jgi:hypothetical protein
VQRSSDCLSIVRDHGFVIENKKSLERVMENEAGKTPPAAVFLRMMLRDTALWRDAEKEVDKNKTRVPWIWTRWKVA